MKYLPDPQSLDARVLGFREWCQLNNLSEITGRRLLKAGRGPIITQLSPRRIGITIANNRTWQDARARAPSTALLTA
jgi:hypothetical protein